MTPSSPSTTVNAPATYFSQLDGLRWIAVSLVMADHWLGERNTLPLGYFGVNLFFVLSGFLISRILLNSKATDDQRNRGHGRSLFTFYMRRNLTILVLAAIDFPAVRNTFGWLMTYTTNLWIIKHQTWLGAIDHLWSLAVEEQFYLFFPFLILFIPARAIVPALIGLVALSVGIRIGLLLANAPWMTQFVFMPTSLDAFGMGGLLAWAFRHKREATEAWLQNNLWLLLAGLLYGLNLYLMKTAATPRNIYNDVTDRFVTSVFCVLLIGRAAIGFGQPVRWLLANPVAVYLGQISYGLYLFHNLVFNAYHTPPTYLALRVWDKATRLVPILGNVPDLRLLYFYGLTVLIATISWYVIEKPINRLKDRFAY
jgi:peptidoglycan/LPS O-acetylase OafA/YrhL